MDLVKVANACAVECVRQKVDIRELRFLLEAYEWLVDRQESWVEIMRVQELMPISEKDILILGSFIEPSKTRHGYRKIAVTFQNGGSSCPASLIPEKMSVLIENINAFNNDPPPRGAPRHQMAIDFESMARALVKEFLWIHPFEDGNGRTGFLLWNWLMGTLDEPTALPDFDW